MSKKIKVTLLKSPSGRLPNHRATVKALGLLRVRQTVELVDSAPLRGMINTVKYLVAVEE